MRHLMSIRAWEPAGRYEFQSRRHKEGWTVEDIAQRFGRKKSEVLRDLKAQSLYHDFLKWETRKNEKPPLSYNAFAEAARATVIMKWLGWSETDSAVHNKQHEHAFFSYLTLRLSRNTPTDSEEEIEFGQSAESVVRTFRDMLKLEDGDINESLNDLEFDRAELLFLERREGDFAKRIAGYIRGLKNATLSELEEGARENKRLLNELIDQAQSKAKYINRSVGEEMKSLLPKIQISQLLRAANALTLEATEERLEDFVATT